MTAPVCLGAREEFVCKDSGRGARPLRIRARGLRRHAQPRSPAHRRAGQGDSLHRHAGLEAAPVASLAPRAATAAIPPATQTALPRFTPTLAAVLAVPLLRFQRLESDQVRRETPLHAYESSEEKSRRSSQGLTLEQFLILREEGVRIGSHRSYELI